MKTLMQSLCPPILKDSLNKVLKRSIRWEGNFSSWEEAQAQCIGYDPHIYLQKLISITKQVCEDESKCERDSVLLDNTLFPYPLLTNLFAISSTLQSKHLFILDFGGSLGSLYFQNRKFLRCLPPLTWNILDQEAITEAGEKHFQTEELLFYSSLYQAKKSIKPYDTKILILSGVLQYLSSPYETLQNLLDLIKFDGIIIDRTLFSRKHHTITIQKVPKTIYNASYACHLLLEKELLKKLGGGVYYA